MTSFHDFFRNKQDQIDLFIHRFKYIYPILYICIQPNEWEYAKMSKLSYTSELRFC